MFGQVDEERRDGFFLPFAIYIKILKKKEVKS